MKFIMIYSLFYLILLSGCSTLSNIGTSKLHVAVDSLTTSNATLKKHYFLLPGNVGVTEADLQFQEYAGYLKRVLEEKGYIYTGSEEDADLVIYLSYGIGDPEVYQYAYSEPDWGYTGYLYPRTHVVTETTDSGEKKYRSYTTYVPMYGITGYNTYIGSRTAYNRFAVIAAYDHEAFKKEKKEVQLWKTTITSSGTSDDLRRIFPVLMAASIPYLATDTGHKVYVRLSETDNAVIKVKGIPAEKK
ncbi:MAG: hypothetical protein PVG39_11840 [Desulfobacteraceae bacterium]|jgi:hypothetical protein